MNDPHIFIKDDVSLLVARCVYRCMMFCRDKPKVSNIFNYLKFKHHKKQHLTCPLYAHYRLLRYQAQPHILCVKSIHASNKWKSLLALNVGKVV